MRKRKLQIFLSSTYEDLIDHRLAAMEAILAAGHIPAAMEQFSPGDETAWEKIRRWIDESDAFILILGGRYGSIEPVSGKSYVQMEYEYALHKKKPFVALVVSDKHHEERLKEFGSKVDERQHPEKYKAFRASVTQWHCKFWDDQKDIKSAIFQKLPDWDQRDDLIRWVRGDEATNPEVMNELARLSNENRKLRETAGASTQTFLGVTFDELFDLLGERVLSREETVALLNIGLPQQTRIATLLHAFGELFRMQRHVRGAPDLTPMYTELLLYGLVDKGPTSTNASGREYFSITLTPDGLRFRNGLLVRSRSSSKDTGNAKPTGSP
jgi:hypothetical protein